MTAILGPHRAIDAKSEQERFAIDLFDRLWDRYRRRVSYVNDYERVVAAAGATFVNDHIAFRTFGIERPMAGIFTLSRVFEALGYRAAGAYHFEDKHLSATHLQHANPKFPKLFISELKTWELSPATRGVISRALESHTAPLPEDVLAELAAPNLSSQASVELMPKVLGWFHDLPWQAPEKSAVQALNKESQYAAWVLVHGYNVNHFTSLINSHGVPALDDIEKTIAALQAAGVPMKNEIEGERGSKLRQTATEAVLIDVDVRDAGHASKIPWTYAYFELAQRDVVPDPMTGKMVRFEGFLGPQATNLFEMTKVK
jgi:hypothetical protein